MSISRVPVCVKTRRLVKISLGSVLRAPMPPLSLGPLKIGDIIIPGRVLAAPMTGVTDLPARRIAVREGAPYVATEMVACDAFAKGRPDVVRRAAGEDLPLKV